MDANSVATGRCGPSGVAGIVADEKQLSVHWRKKARFASALVSRDHLINPEHAIYLPLFLTQEGGEGGGEEALF